MTAPARARREGKGTHREHKRARTTPATTTTETHVTLQGRRWEKPGEGQLRSSTEAKEPSATGVRLGLPPPLLKLDRVTQRDGVGPSEADECACTAERVDKCAPKRGQGESEKRKGN